MAQRISPEERQLLKLIEQLPTSSENRARWSEEIEQIGFTEELADEIRQALTTAPEGETENEAVTRTRHMMEFTQAVKRWRLAYQSRHFARR